MFLFIFERILESTFISSIYANLLEYLLRYIFNKDKTLFLEKNKNIILIQY